MTSVTRRRFVQATAVAASGAALAAAVTIATRSCEPNRVQGAPSPVAAYVDHDGWMLTPEESRKLREQRASE
jgi:hypothetical protein